MASTTPPSELYSNYKNYESTISGVTTYDILTDLGRPATFVRIYTSAAVTIKINGGDTINVLASTEYKITDKIINTLLVTPTGSTVLSIFCD